MQVEKQTRNRRASQSAWPTAFSLGAAHIEYDCGLVRHIPRRKRIPDHALAIQAAQFAATGVHDIAAVHHPWLENTERFSEIWTEQYIQTYVERDVARLFPSLNRVRFRRFIELLTGYSGSIINYSNIAKVLDVSQPTARDYFDITHGTFIWRTIPAYSKNTRKRVSKHPRGYLRDSGLLHHILQIPSHRKLLTHPQMGAAGRVWSSKKF